jgi:Secretion system C-terminal sorting domain
MNKLLLLFISIFTVSLACAQNNGHVESYKHLHQKEDTTELLHCGLDEAAIKVMKDYQEKAMIKRFGSIENWRAKKEASKKRLIQSRAATCDLKLEIVKLGDAPNLLESGLNSYISEFGSGGEFEHPTNIIVVANSVVVPNLYDIFPTSLTYVEPSQSDIGAYHIDIVTAMVTDMPTWTGYASNQTNQTIVEVPRYWNGPNGNRRVKIFLNGQPVAGANVVGNSDGSYPQLDPLKEEGSHGFMLITTQQNANLAMLLCHETGHGLGLGHNSLVGNYMGPFDSRAPPTQYTSSDRIICDLSLQNAGPLSVNGSRGWGFFETQCNSVALAVDLVAFEGIKGQKNVKLRWKTASEKNNDYFVIEKSRDGQIFEDMIKVTSQGSSTDIAAYETLDNAPTVGMNYYRLKSVDKGGQIATSKIVSVAFVEKIKLNVYPNPTLSSKINVELTAERDERFDFEVVDIAGKIIHTTTQNVTSGSNIIAFDNMNISKGIYFVRAKQNNIVIEVVRFVRL